ncbi:MAG: DUF4402 domain-containing protein [Bacteroidota bacterium]
MEKSRLKTIGFLIWLLSFGVFQQLSAQENPPIPISVEVNTARNLNFGAFTVGTTGGTLSVSYDDILTPNLDVFPMNIGGDASAALFDVTANPGTIISIRTPGEIKLTGSNGGQIYLNIDSFSTGQTFVTTAHPPMVNEVYIGGTLTIPGHTENLTGTYNGSFTLEFIHQ